MSLGVKLTTFAAALVLAGSAFATEESCPRLMDIQHKGIQNYYQYENYYFGYATSQYNSSSTWVFAIGPINAELPEEALDQSNVLLQQMSFEGQQVSENPLVCLYETGDQSIQAFAIRDVMISPTQLKQYLPHTHK